MINGNKLAALTNQGVNFSRAVTLFQDTQHQISWVGAHTGGKDPAHVPT